MGLRLNFRQIEAFRAVMVTGSMTTAAEVLYITQPAVSRLVSDLEHSLGLQLFDRRGNQITPRTVALEFLHEVERSFLGLSHLEAHAMDLKTGRLGTLRIAALPAMAVHFLPRFLAAFCQDRPDIRVHLDGLPSYLVVDQVSSGRYDIGICTASWERSTLGSSRIRSSAVVVMPSGHRLAQQEEIQAGDLEGENIIMLGVDSHLQRNVERALSAVNYRRNISTSLTSMACTLVSAGTGLTITDPFSASEFAGRGVVVTPFTPSIDVGYRIVFPRGRPLSSLAAAFRAELEVHLKRHLATG